MHKTIKITCLFLFLILNSNYKLVAQQDGRLDSSFGVNGSIVHSLYANKSIAYSSVTNMFTGSNGKTYLLGTSSKVDGNSKICMSCLNPNGSIDLSFGNNGRVYFAESPYLTLPSIISIRVDSLNRIVFGRLDFSLLRFLPNGNLDANFGTNGYVKLSVNGFANTNLKAMDFQSDGKIIAVGIANTPGKICITARFNQNGSLDSSFNNLNGLITGAFNTGIYNSEGIGMLVQPDGKIVVVGNAYNQYNSDFAVTRYLNNGLIDSSYGNNGVNKINFDFGDDVVGKIAPASQGGLLVLGTMKLLTGSTNYIVVKFLSNGQLDNTFGTSGKYVVSSSSGLFYGWKNDGALLGTLSSGELTLKNYLRNGTLDPNFGSAGTLTLAKTIFPLLSLSGMDVLDSNHLIFAGYNDIPNDKSFAYIKVNQNGTVDSSFGSNGLGFIQMGASYYNAISSGKFAKLAVQPDQKIIVVGSAIPSSYPKILIVRFLPNGQRDPAYGNNGNLVLEEGMAKGVLPLSDGSLLVSGYIKTNNTQKKAILFKLKSDGTYDNNFGVNGRSVIANSLGNGLNEFNDIDLQSDGKIIVTGSGIGRFFANGQLDSAFGNNGFNQSIYGVNAVINTDNTIVVAGDTTLAKFSSNGKTKLWSYLEKWTYHCGPGVNPIFNYAYYEPFIDNDENIFVRGGRFFDPDYNYTHPCAGSGGDVQFMFNKDGVPITSFGIGGKSSVLVTEKRTGVLSLGSKVLCFSNGISTYSILKNLSNGTPYGPFGGGGKITFAQNQIKPINNYTYEPFKISFQNDSSVVSSFLRNDTLFLAKHFIEKDERVDFTIIGKKTGTLTDTFQLHATGTSKVIKYNWSIPNAIYLNGTDSTSVEPFVQFLSSGYKNIKLTGITMNSDFCEKTKSNFITVASIDFSATQNFAEVIVPIKLFSNCLPTPSNYQWEIEGNPSLFSGYGLTSSGPYFQYLDTGLFSVKLIAKYANGDSIILGKPNFIRINDLSFTQDKSISTIDSPFFHFYANSKPIAKRYVWSTFNASGQLGNPISFPNGNEIPNVLISALDTGWYSVQLVAYYSDKDSLIELKNHAFYVSAVIQNNKPIAEFSVTKQYGEIDELFYFNDKSSYFPNNWKWTFTPNNVWLVSSDYTSQNPIVSFYANGFYQISLRVSNPFGADSITKTDFIRIGKATSLNSKLKLNTLQIYPNPAQDILQLRTEPNSNIEIEIYAFNGTLVQTEKVRTDANGLTQLNTEKLSEGFYHLRIKSNLGELGKAFGISR